MPRSARTAQRGWPAECARRRMGVHDVRRAAAGGDCARGGEGAPHVQLRHAAGAQRDRWPRPAAGITFGHVHAGGLVTATGSAGCRIQPPTHLRYHGGFGRATGG